MSKTLFVWDLAIALENLDDECYGWFAGNLGFASWRKVTHSLKRTRLCIISFHGASAWSSSDWTFVSMSSSGRPLAVFLPIYTRMLWYLRCADCRSWTDFCSDVQDLLNAKATTVEDVIAEALAIFREQPTILVVEELSQVSKDILGRSWRSPAGDACSFEDEEPRELEVSLVNAYRHELCTCTRLPEVSVLFTAVSFGMLYSELHLNDSDVAKLDDSVADAVRLMRDAAVVEQLLVSLRKSPRWGSPFFLLNAVEIGFVDINTLADDFFLPAFARAVIHTSLPANLTYQQPDATSARAFARLSGGHPRSASFLRQQLLSASSGGSDAV